MGSQGLASNKNQVPPGYKQTEVGVIPEDWDIQPVGNAFEIRNNLRLPISKKIRDSMQGRYPYYGPTSVQGYISEYRIEGEHALIGEDGDHFLKWRDVSMTLLVNGKFNVNNHAHIIKGVNNLTTWFYYFFSHRDLTPYLKRQGAGRYKLNKSTLINIPCAIPPLPEQKAIASVLSDVDELISALDKLIAKKRHIKTATMQQLLTGKTRLPGFGEGMGYKKSAIGLIPEDWEVVNYGEHLNIISGLGFKKSEYTNYGVKLLRIDNICYGTITWDSIAFLPENYIDKYNHLVIKENDILLALNRPITNNRLKIAMAKKADALSILYQRVGKIVFTSQAYDKKYAFHLLFMFIKQFVEESAVGTDQPFISTTNLKKYKLPLPPKLEEQKAIASVLSDMDQEITALEKRRAKTQAIKQGMMQELLTGKTRIIDN